MNEDVLINPDARIRIISEMLGKKKDAIVYMNEQIADTSLEDWYIEEFVAAKEEVTREILFLEAEFNHLSNI